MSTRGKKIVSEILPGLGKMYSDVIDQKTAIEFLKENIALRQVVFNPSKNSGQTSSTFQKYDVSRIVQWLQNPQANERNLRIASIYMYLCSMEYQRLIEYYAGLPLWQYVVLPVIMDESKNSGKINKAYYKALKFLHNLNLPEMMRNQGMPALFREGAYYGVLRTDENVAFLQRVDPNICKISSISDGVCFYSVDMSKIRSDDLQYYPKEFEKMAREANATGVSWQEVPPEISFCLKSDASIIGYSVPPFAATMPALYKIADAKDRYDVSSNQKNYKLIAGQVPLDSEGSLAMDYDLFLRYYNHLAQNIDAESGIGLAVTPFKIEAFDFNKSGITNEIDDITRMTNNFWSGAGTPPILHGSSNDHAGIIKFAIKNDEAFVDKIVRQVERLLNRLLKIELSSGSMQCRIEILPTTIFNVDEYIKRVEGAATKGIGKLYYMAAIGQKQIDFLGIDYIENSILNLEEKLKPLKNTYNTGTVTDSGRPLADDENLTPSGEQARADDTNANR